MDCISFETKRNLITNSAEFYNLSYEYLNDCLKAGLVYRSEFYTDSELEPENSLMFKITLTPFGNINSPSFINEKNHNFLFYFILNQIILIQKIFKIIL